MDSLRAYPNNSHARNCAVLFKSPARLRLRRPLYQRGPTDVERLARGFLPVDAPVQGYPDRREKSAAELDRL
jgi:hypothetical protein